MPALSSVAYVGRSRPSAWGSLASSTITWDISRDQRLLDVSNEALHERTRYEGDDAGTADYHCHVGEEGSRCQCFQLPGRESREQITQRGRDEPDAHHLTNATPGRELGHGRQSD